MSDCYALFPHITVCQELPSKTDGLQRQRELETTLKDHVQLLNMYEKVVEHQRQHMHQVSPTKSSTTSATCSKARRPGRQPRRATCLQLPHCSPFRQACLPSATAQLESALGAKVIRHVGSSWLAWHRDGCAVLNAFLSATPGSASRVAIGAFAAQLQRGIA